ncbi:MAG: signal peptidase II [Thermotoga sp.]|nr:MAG: signal peptidase II [Thermotoga sp.]
MLILSVILLIFILDRITKLVIRNIMNPGDVIPIVGFVKIMRVENVGIAFGFLKGSNLVIYAIIIVLIFLIYLAFSLRKCDRLGRVGMGMIIGGALGNLTDRIIFGRVTDFISLGSFPVFNVADSSITIGTVLVGISMMIQEGIFDELAKYIRRGLSNLGRRKNVEAEGEQRGEGNQVGSLPVEETSKVDIEEHDTESYKGRKGEGERIGGETELQAEGRGGDNTGGTDEGKT